MVELRVPGRRATASGARPPARGPLPVHVPVLRPVLVCLLVAVLFALLVLPRTAAWAAPDPAAQELASQPVQRALLLAARAGAVVLVAAATWAVLHLAARLRSGSRFHRRWVAWSGALLGVCAVLLAATWPGYWAWDEYAVLTQVRSHVFDSWQTVLTPLWFSALTHVVPGGATVVVAQVLLAAGVGGWVLAWVGELTGRRWPVLAVAALLVSPPVLLNDLYPLRLTVYAHLALAVVCRLVVQRVRPDAVRRPALELVVLAGAVGVLAAWRSEGVLWLLVLPVLVHRLAWRPWRARTAELRAGALRAGALRTALAPAAAVLVGGALVVSLLGLVHATENRRYRLTAAINPLSLMLQQPLRGEHLAADLAAMDAALDLDAVRAQPDPDDVTSFRAAARPDAAEHLDAFQGAYARTVLTNPDAFLRARWQTFARTSALQPVVAQVRRGEAYREPPTGAGLDAQRAAEAAGDLPPAADPQLRRAVVRALLLVDDQGRLLPVAALVWTALPVLVLLGTGLVVALARRWWRGAALAALPLGTAALVFATAPASFFMYYLPTVMTGWLVVVLGAARLVHRPGPPEAPAAGAAVGAAEAPAVGAAP